VTDARTRVVVGVWQPQVPPYQHAPSNVWREDVVRPSLPIEVLEKMSPVPMILGHFVVPRVLPGDEE
jgi:Asp-tRNA(Asn)/Glu-tRNA(Gln) amidotransferase C subunit